MHPLSRFLGIAGAVVALPSFVLDAAFHGGSMFDPGSADRLDGVFSLMLMTGAALVVAAIFAGNSPLGRKGRFLLVVEAAMIALAALWSAIVIIEPGIAVDDPNVLVRVCDACGPLHQAFMLVVGIAAARAKRWPSPIRYTLFGPVVGLAILAAGAAAGVAYLAAFGLGFGWAIAGLGVAALNRQANSQGSFMVQPAPAA